MKQKNETMELDNNIVWKCLHLFYKKKKKKKKGLSKKYWKHVKKYGAIVRAKNNAKIHKT